jgi:hypothetical protein
MLGDHHLIDHNARNDRMTPSVTTPRSSRFRDEVMRAMAQGVSSQAMEATFAMQPI